MQNLSQISSKYFTGDSKGGDKCIRHNYCDKYDLHFLKYRYKKLNLLEIGVMQGRSLVAWRDYFPNANILGIDIKHYCKQYEDDRIKIEIGDQKDKSFLAKVEKKHGPFEVIIDDGSHFWMDVVTSFKFLFPLLKEGGIYVIEDLHTSYCEQCSKDCEISPIEYLKKSIDKINMFGKYTPHNVGMFARAADKQKSVLDSGLSKTDCDYDIYSMSFYPSICFIEKENYEKHKRKIY
jgi:hypothetical protein